MYRSAGWSCLDAIEVDLLAAGLLERVPSRDVDGALREGLRVTDAGLAQLATSLARNRAAFDAHESLVALVARQMQRAGRTAFTGLSLRAPVQSDEGRRWVVARPDVFSIRHTTVAGYLVPTVHEVKARRADLLGELRDTPRTRAKRGAYLAMSSECWYVLGRDGKGREIGEASEIPAEFGVMQAVAVAGAVGAWRLEVVRPAPRRPLPHEAGLPFAAWLALARATPHPPAEDDAQALL
ncbi:MAG: hypothetical protein KIS62_15390 [Ramlibacter sp.]|nr:hypothetical protein [Ramlibacter sp.]